MSELDLNSLYPEELTKIVEELGEKKFRSKQIFEWIHKKQISLFDEAGNIPKKLKEDLLKEYTLAKTEVVDCQISKEDGTRKYLFGLYDGNVIESVLMRYHYGNTVCISSQVGCRMGCKFCASTIDGVVRNLSAGEMLSQIYSIEKDTNEIIRKGYLLSMKDLNVSKNMDQLDFVDSYKIEGRMKESNYVGNVTRTYRQIIDGNKPDTKILDKVFNRTYTKGFMLGESSESITNIQKVNNTNNFIKSNKVDTQLSFKYDTLALVI